MVVHKGLLDLFPKDDACVAAGESVESSACCFFAPIFYHRSPSSQQFTNSCCQSWRTRQATPCAATTPNNKVLHLHSTRVRTDALRWLPGFRSIVNSIRLLLSVVLHVDPGITGGLGSLFLQVRFDAR